MPDAIKSYPPTWKGDLLLACRKCQKKLKGESGMRALAKLKKTIKRHNKMHSGTELCLISVPCMDMCPKGAVTVCLPRKIQTPLVLIRTEDEIEALYRENL
jgi:predicted metal-binding protein